MLQTDTTIAVLDAPGAAPGAEAFERAMLSDSKMPVVLGVVLIVWVGVLWLLARTERRLARVERTLRDAEAAPGPRP